MLQFNQKHFLVIVKMPSPILHSGVPKSFWSRIWILVQVNNYEIVINFFHISHNLTWYSAIVTRIYQVCSTYELAKQFMQICVKNCAIDLNKNNQYNRIFLQAVPVGFYIPTDECYENLKLPNIGTLTQACGKCSLRFLNWVRMVFEFRLDRITFLFSIR